MLKVELANKTMGQQKSEAVFVGSSAECTPFREVSGVLAESFAERDQVMSDTLRSCGTEFLFV